MNIFEVVGYIVICLVGIIALLGLIGVLNINVIFSVNGKSIF